MMSQAATCPSCALCGNIVDGDGVKIGTSGPSAEKIYHIECVRYLYLYLLSSMLVLS